MFEKDKTFDADESSESDPCGVDLDEVLTSTIKARPSGGTSIQTSYQNENLTIVPKSLDPDC